MGPSNKKKHIKAKAAASISTHTDADHPVIVNAATTSITAPPNDTSATRVQFRDFIELADLNAIRIFITTASLSPEGENLKLLWARAFKEGLMAGHILYGKTEERLKEAYETGYNEGRREEQEDWIIDGHGFCIQPLQHPHEESSTQTDPPMTTATTTSVSAQTDPISTSSTTYLTSGTQTSLLATTLNTTMDIFAQTNSISTQMSCHIITLPTSVPATSLASPVTIGTQTKTKTSQNLEIGPSTRVAMPQSPALSEDGKKAKIDSTSEISPNLAIFSTTTPCAALLDTKEPSTTSTGCEMRSTSADFAQKHQKNENPPISTQTTNRNPAPKVIEAINDATEVYASQTSPNDATFRPLILSAAASSQGPVVPGHEKNVLLRAVFDSKPPTESPVSTTIVSALENHSETASFMEKHQKDEKSHIFTQKTPDSPISARFNWSDDAYEPPILSTVPTKHPRDISGLRSSSKNPFSSLRRRRRQPRNPHCFINSWSQSNCQYTLPNSRHHIPASHTLNQSSQLRLPVSLDWDQDPRLLDLSNALKALGWVRR
jgi:hypothetical protein